jgi:hypothetical protein
MDKVLNTAARYAKAVVAFVVPAAGTLIAAMQDGSPGGSSITGAEWFAAFLIAAGASVGVGATPNKDPRGLHQDESVQPPERVQDVVDKALQQPYEGL